MKIVCFLLLLNYLYATKHTNAQESLLSTDDVEVTNIIKRPETYYTQGLFFIDKETLVESGGLYGESVLAKMEFPSLKIITKNKLSDKYFGEGTAKCGEFVYQLTWRERKILKYKFPDLTFVESFEMEPQMKYGWGLTDFSDPNVLVGTDGTDKLFFLDCNNNLKAKKTLKVEYKDKPVDRLNDLCFANGYLWVNRYFDNGILKINPNTGKGEKLYDMSPLVRHEMQQKTLTQFNFVNGDVLNGIAYNEAKKNFLVTGKKWGYYYEVNLE